MENFSGEYGYNKGEINTFVDYVIKRTEDNILTINRLNEEINALMI